MIALPRTRFSRAASAMFCGVVGVWFLQAFVRDNFIENPLETLQKSVSFRLRQPQYLPSGYHLDPDSPTKGVIRGAIWRYEGTDHFIGIAEEKRNPKRDAYNRKTFKGKRAEGNIYITYGFLRRTGQKFVYREFDDVSAILTTHGAPLKDMVRMARSMQ